MTTQKTDSELQAEAQLEHIVELMAALDSGTQVDGQDPEEAIQEKPLSVEVRSGWVSNYQDRMIAAEYNILLCTGGPAVRIIGELNQHEEPESARLEHQDWGTSWTEFFIPRGKARDALLQFAFQFYYGG